MIMSKVDNGGPAFPLLKPAIGYHADIQQAEEGLSLRDFFAAKAMAAIIAQPEGGLNYEEDGVAAAAFEMADAMIRARGAA